MKRIIETKRLIITEFTPDMAPVVRDNSLDEDNKRFVPDEVWETIEEAEETLKFLISQYCTFCGPLVYPIIVKETKDNIGYVELCPIENGKWEIGYWLGVPFWGRGLIPEATRELIHHAFTDLHLDTLWCGYFDGNEKSKRCQEKCGFTYHHTNKDIYWKLMDDIRTEHITKLTKEEWRVIQ